MNWDAVGAIGEVVGAAAVVITLVYLAIQIRQNTKQIEENTYAVRAAAIESSLSYTFNNRAAVFSDEGTAKVYEKGLESIDSLSGTELLRFRLIVNNIFDAFLNMYSQTKRTNFSPEIWQSQAFLLSRVLDSSGGAWFWENQRGAYPEDFQAEIQRIRALPPNKAVE